MIRIKRNHSNIILTRTGHEAILKLSFDNQKQRKRVEGNIVEFFNDDDEVITIIDEPGNLVRVISP